VHVRRGDVGGVEMRVFLADDHRLMLAAIRTALEREDDIEIVGTTTDAANVLPLVAELRPDVVVLDVVMPQIDGLAVLERIRARFDDISVVLLSASEDQSLVGQAREKGASAFVHKQIDPVELAPILRKALDSHEFQSVGIGADTAELAAEAGMTKKEQLVLDALARGLSNQQIAQELWVTEQTVKFHLSNIYRKLDVRNRTEAAQHALRRGLVRRSEYAREV
jgi:DNA-binding NarL/FixJ family response regulator